MEIILVRVPIASEAGVGSWKRLRDNAFRGPDLWLQVPGGDFTQSNPRQQITSCPYSISCRFSLEADSAFDSGQLGGVGAARYIVTIKTPRR